jgi:hypothetical protein
LNPGDSFRDKSVGRDVVIEGEEQIAVAGVTRTITNATTSERLKRWDKSTGVFVECIDALEDYSINATAVRTSMWGNQMPKFGIIDLLTCAAVASIVVVAAGVLIAPRRMKRMTWTELKNNWKNQK